MRCCEPGHRVQVSSERATWWLSCFITKRDGLPFWQSQARQFYSRRQALYCEWNSHCRSRGPCQICQDCRNYCTSYWNAIGM